MFITDEAKNFLLVMLKENDAENIKIFSNGGGCCGPSVGLAMDDPNEEDIVEDINQIKVAFEKSIYKDLENVTIDYQQTPQGESLVLEGLNQGC
ncbi:adhesin [Salipaludibacillus daqingensis]|uniref:adhesin n=1 Tax=Salipaludibacillus daqingensis TaxID=3041001 RepID=UPI0024762F2D|nr:adhesin [Salipaludibacillus daqingensis]